MPKLKLETKDASIDDTAHHSSELEEQESADTRRARFPARFYAAVRRRDSAKVLRMAKSAGFDRCVEAVRPLSDFLVPPNSRWKVSRRRKPEWRQARAAAAWALGQLGEPASYGTLATVMVCDPDPIVREAACAAIDQCGPDAIPALVTALRAENDWRLEGMRELLVRLGSASGLSESARRNVGMALIDVLYENFPIAPRRWMKPAREIGRFVGLLVTIGMTITYLLDGWYWPVALFTGWILGQLAGLGTKMFASFFTAGLQSPTECGQLYPIAAQALVRLNDKRAIPGMLQLAFLTPLSKTWRHARAVLLALLPHLSAADYNLFSASDVEIINGAITQALEPKLTVGLLHALEFVGNASSIRPVMRLTERSKAPEVMQEATRVGGILQTRVDRAKMSKNLLRGSQSPGAEPSEMLRAAVLQQEQRPELLLRPVEEERNLST